MKPCDHGWEDKYGESAACHACFTAEVERLQAIVDRLPKTKDGVTVYDGDFVFARSGERYQVSGRYAHGIGLSEGSVEAVSDMYSSVEAIKKARGA